MAKEMTPEELLFAEQQMEREALHHSDAKSSKHWAMVSAFTVLLSWPVFLCAGKLHSGEWFWQTASVIAESEARAVAAETKLDDLTWLWHSHNLTVALLEDDPKFLEKNTNGCSCFEFFLAHATTARQTLFNKTVHDGFHPHLEGWLSSHETTQVSKL
jgi:hypothetical protein